MSFCSYSKEFLSSSFTSIENQFITNYMPQSDGFTVKVYLYGLYLCQNKNGDFDIKQMAAFLGKKESDVIDAFSFWEDCDLVRILMKNPFTVEYLPVSGAIGRPKKVNYNRYEDFNKEMQNKMQKAGKFISYNETIRYMNFLQENQIEQDAFLLIAQYCIDKKKENVTQTYIFNKAKKFISLNLITYEQVEKELSGYNIHESELIAIFNSLNTFKSPEEGDYTLYEKWTAKYGISLNGIKIAAKTLKKGNMDTLDVLMTELYENGKQTDEEIKAYLEENEMLSSLTFRIARKLSVKINSPQTYIDEYVRGWYNKGYSEAALSSLAVYCTKLSRNSFIEMDSIIDDLFKKSIISDEAVNGFLAEKNSELKLLIQIKSVCPSVRISAGDLSMINVWHEWDFNNAMILEAAKRSAQTVNPIPYMNKILSGWKHQGIFKASDIPEAPISDKKKEENKLIEALDNRAERERFYSERRRRAQAAADKFIKKAETNPEYVKVSSDIRAGNIELAKAQVFTPEKANEISSKLKALTEKMSEILASMGIKESDLLPAYTCKKCSDTGFMPDGKICDCYKGN